MNSGAGESSWNERVADVLDEVLAAPAETREATLDRLTAGDDRLRAEVRSLVRSSEKSGKFLAPQRDLLGVCFGSSRIVERLGEGGMGVVYRAVDERLERDVAIKVLSGTWSESPERRARLEREARALAALNHRRIASIYGLEESAAAPGRRTHLGLLMEFVLGTTLDRVHLPLEWRDAIRIVSQIADGLEASHARGIVHRDLKPSNISLTPTGDVKLLDFGLAKAWQESPPPDTGSRAAPLTPLPPPAPTPATKSLLLTREGMLLGTPAYMSPEQAAGRPADRRADMWALGCILAELITGVRVFQRGDTRETLDAVRHHEPELAALDAIAPREIGYIVRRCLRKDPDLRLRDAGDLRVRLEEILATPPDQGRSGISRRQAIAAGGVTLALVGLGGAWLGRRLATPRIAPASPIRFTFDASELLPTRWDMGASFALSPDGRSIVYAAYRGAETQNLYLRRLDDPTPKRLVDAGPARTPCFSPDGTWIAYSDSVSGQLRRIRPDTGDRAEWSGIVSDAGGLAWTSMGHLVFTLRTVLWTVSTDAHTSGASQLSKLDEARGDLQHAQPCQVPGRDAIVFSVELRRGKSRTCGLAVVELGRPASAGQIILENASAPQFHAGNVLLFSRGEWIMAARFDPVALRILGTPVRVVGPLPPLADRLAPARFAGAAGSLVHLPQASEALPTCLAWVGSEGSFALVHEGTTPIHSLRLSPDGSRVAFAAGDGAAGIWVRDMNRGTLTPVEPNPSRDHAFPVWSRDGSHLYFRSDGAGTSRIVSCRVDSASTSQTVLEVSDRFWASPEDLLPDSRTLLITINPRSTDPSDIYAVPLEAPEQKHTVFPLLADRGSARISPAGDMLLYSEFDTGTTPTYFRQNDAAGLTVYLQPWPSLNERHQVSAVFGKRPTWRRDGRAVYYQVRNHIYEVEVLREGEALSLSKPKLVLASLPESPFDAGTEPGRFIAAVPPGALEPVTRFAFTLGFGAMVERALAGPPTETSSR
ncbi:MAG: serine/threonine-protein kinase [Phycisphaerae bacterium]|nr:serine/threonine-protein kinase [Phycisphaerae bacterium]